MVESKTEPVRKVVFIIVDGISADVLEEVDTPNIDEVIAQGTYTRGWLGGEGRPVRMNMSCWQRFR